MNQSSYLSIFRYTKTATLVLENVSQDILRRPYSEINFKLLPGHSHIAHVKAGDSSIDSGSLCG